MDGKNMIVLTDEDHEMEIKLMSTYSDIREDYVRDVMIPKEYYYTSKMLYYSRVVKDYDMAYYYALKANSVKRDDNICYIERLSLYFDY